MIYAPSGFETLAGTTTMCIARLSTDDGPEIQVKAYEEIMRVYDEEAEKAIGNAYKKEALEYIVCLYRETFVS